MDGLARQWFWRHRQRTTSSTKERKTERHFERRDPFVIMHFEGSLRMRLVLSTLLFSLWPNDMIFAQLIAEDRQGMASTLGNNAAAADVEESSSTSSSSRKLPPPPALHRPDANMNLPPPPPPPPRTTLEASSSSSAHVPESASLPQQQQQQQVPQTKLSAIFPTASLPDNDDTKENWQQHLAEQFKAFRSQDVDDSFGGTKNNRRFEGNVAEHNGNQVRTTQRQLSSGRDVRFQGDFAFSGEEDVLDERTLLDVFGEAAKEFLTQRVIPDTDKQCRWDWRSVRCEPACECNLEGQWGDYHLGRACRLREEVDESCVPVDPASIWQDKPATRRILSLFTQTVDILRQKVVRGVDDAMSKAAKRFSKMQHNQCDDLWKLYQDQVQGRTCLPPALVPHRSMPQRVLCGPVDFHVCEDSSSTRDTVARAAFVERQ